MNEEIKETVDRMNDLLNHRFDKEYHTECDLFDDIENLLNYINKLEEQLKKKENAYNKAMRDLVMARTR